MEQGKESTPTTTAHGTNFEDWEGMCNRCGECCRNGDNHCPHLFASTCSVYPNREFFRYCMTVDEMYARGKMPEQCGYRTVFEGEK